MDSEKAERFNVITSMLGAMAAPIGAAFLVERALRTGDPWKFVSFGLYGITLVLLYVVATLYHAQRGRVKRFLRELDHCAIFLLIAGTYTPFCLVTLHGGLGWTLLALVWGLAVVGIVVELWPVGTRRILPVAIYVAMGWMIVFALRPMLQALPWQGVALLLAGGLFYTGGIVFYTLDKRFAWAHGVWHLFVLAGSISHYLSVLQYVARTGR